MADEQAGQDDAPRFMVLYCSIMILLLAFFIILQSLASSQKEGMFHAGKGSFVRALETFGLGRFFATHGLSGPGRIGARYDLNEAENDGTSLARDPEMEAARRALEKLKDDFAVSDNGEGKWGATVFAPVEPMEAGDDLSERQRTFFTTFARHALPELMARGSVIGVGAIYPASEDKKGANAVRAMELARKARQEIVQQVPQTLAEGARRYVYSFCRVEDPGGDADGIHLNVEVCRVKRSVQEVSE